jgi:hypothetical protein
MKQLSKILLAITITGFLTTSCNNHTATDKNTDDKVVTEFSQTKKSETSKIELDAAFKNLWPNVTLSKADEFFKTNVSDDFYTINADGIVQNKAQLLEDKKRLELLEILDFKFFDQVIKVYGNVGIVNGRLQAFSEETYVGEVLYTAIFVNENDTWLYKNWQGTWSIDSPPPPSFTSKD